ncbi:unnamed protein product [Lymnaea stagnalis]|uniref:Uncharacterized protein n=1 Tax=Lymnaea stagnalis TaxID=6523 RepID=A0AAV2HXS1_LYMST
MCARYVMPMCYVMLLCAAVMSAPVNKENEVRKRSADSPASKAHEQEDDLLDLLSLVNKESHQNNVMVHKEKVSHFENNGGEKVKVEQKEEKVVDAKTGNVIADVKQEVKQEASGSSNPETVVKTKVDIPAEGVHETFVQAGEETKKTEASEENDLEPELTPADMAEYLYNTQQFEAFYSALDRLVNQSKMTYEDAEIYARTVALEYQRLQLEDFEEKFVAEKRMYPRYPIPADVYGQVPVDLESGPSYATEERYPASELYGYPAQALVPEEQYIQQQQELAGLGSDVNLYEFLAALWNEAYGKGNEEAQEIVRMLYDRVSQDDNPDDIGQIRDILVETVAASLNEKPYNLQPNEIRALEAAQQSSNQQSALNKVAEQAIKENAKEKVKEEIKQEIKEEIKEKVKEEAAVLKAEEKLVQEVKEELKEAKAEKQAENKSAQQKQ